MKSVPLSVRAILAFITLPCVFAGLIPLLIVDSDKTREAAVFGREWAALPICVGIIILLGAVRDFFVFGRGTLAPWDPPKRLVIAGLYRYVRNPMYVGITIFLLGSSWLAGSKWLLAYSAFLLGSFHLRILLYEEPILARTFPEDWTIYSRAVRRWLPRLSPWIPPG
jgi:protein-S-isoprenylcysteine O-methyltransferase Ste14